jgi:hypothetical protein
MEVIGWNLLDLTRWALAMSSGVSLHGNASGGTF